MEQIYQKVNILAYFYILQNCKKRDLLESLNWLSRERKMTYCNVVYLCPLPQSILVYLLMLRGAMNLEFCPNRGGGA